jgi:peptidoglycan hydrolase-like protein with peptidoglycan-binding domain
VLYLYPAAAAAQGMSSSRGKIRVVETLDPSTYGRTRQVVRDLTPEEIRSVQRALREAGFRLSWLTGKLDRATRDALSDFQVERGLVVCGCASYETVVALGLRPSVIMTLIAASAGSVSPGDADVRAAVYYPIPIPIRVPGPGEPEDGEDGEEEMPVAGPPLIVPEIPNRPGVRPAPPLRVSPTGASLIEIGRAFPPDPRIVH